jgi:hypothetical protein
MGEAPSHPELLDWLACELIDNGWSLKHVHRLIVSSRAYRMASVPDPRNREVDPENRWLHRANVRRLEAEALRDAMLSVAGTLDQTFFGPSVPPYLTEFMQGRGRPAASGPLDGANRRTLYLNIRRNFVPALLSTFDFPAPATTMGRRNVSNVPAQALTLLNDPFVVQISRRWGVRVGAQSSATRGERVSRMFQSALGRAPTNNELAAALEFLDGSSSGDQLEKWSDLAQVLLNHKEFLFIR